MQQVNGPRAATRPRPGQRHTLSGLEPAQELVRHHSPSAAPTSHPQPVHSQSTQEAGGRGRRGPQGRVWEAPLHCPAKPCGIVAPRDEGACKKKGMFLGEVGALQDHPGHRRGGHS